MAAGTTTLWVGAAPPNGEGLLFGGGGLPTAPSGPLQILVPDPRDADPRTVPLALRQTLTQVSRTLDEVVVGLPPSERLLDGRPGPEGSGVAAHRWAEWLERACRVVPLPESDPHWLRHLRADDTPGTWDPHRSASRSAWVHALRGAPAQTDQVVVLHSRRPLHPGRALAWLLADWPGVWRARGYAWTSDRPEVVAELDRVGPHADLRGSGTWWVNTDRRHWPSAPHRLARLAADWHPDFGDRSVRIAVLGEGLDSNALWRSFETALMSDRELEPEWRGAAGPPPRLGSPP